MGMPLGKKDLNSGFQYLRRAANLGHLEVEYVTGIILILDGGEELGKQTGMKIIGDMKKSKKKGKEIKDIREKFSSFFRTTEVLEQVRPTCCTRHQHAEIANENIANSGCEACSCDEEIVHLWKVIPYCI